MKPNILWICTDQQRGDTISCLGNPHINTPNLDKLCAEGTAFKRAYCQSPICTPSRASFLSGLYPSSIHANSNGNECYANRVPMITKLLADIGYTCGLTGKLHLASAFFGMEKRCNDGYSFFEYSHSPRWGMDMDYKTGNGYMDYVKDLGSDKTDVFNENCLNGNKTYVEKGYAAPYYKNDMDISLHQTTFCFEKAMEFIKNNEGKPWLMSINAFDPHPPFSTPDEYTNRYDAKKLPKPLFGEGDIENDRKLSGAYFQSPVKEIDEEYLECKARYYGAVELIDEQVGRILDMLDASGQRENTIVIFMSDHGEMLGDHGLIQKGCRFYEGLTNVPLIISWKGHFKENYVYDGLVELIDIVPTLAEITGVELKWCQGKSLVQILTGGYTGIHREAVRCEYYNALNPAHPRHSGFGTMYRTQKYKLNVYHGIEWGELYDLENDPHEFNNLWDVPYMQGVKLELMKKSFDASILCCDPGPELIAYY